MNKFLNKWSAKISKHWFVFIFSIIANGLWIWWFFTAQQATTHIDKIDNQINEMKTSFSGSGNLSLQWNNNATIQGSIQSGSQVYQNSPVQQTIIPKTQEEKRSDEITKQAQSTLADFYLAISNKDFEKVKILSDNTFIWDPNLSRYFSETYLRDFLDIVDGTWKIQHIEEDTDQQKDTIYESRRSFHYEMLYTLKNGQPYKDKWNAIIKYSPEKNAYYVNAITCETKNCTNQPFFTLVRQ